MFRLAKMAMIIAHTPIHAGSGSETGIVDLPIQRERHTGYPKIEGSSMKGCLREAIETGKKEDIYQGIEYQDCINLVFGPEDGNDHAGALSISDAKILLFPVKSAKGVFAWITCPLVIERFKEDLKLIGKTIDIDARALENKVTTSSKLLLNKKASMMLEEFVVPAQVSSEVDKLAQILLESFGDNIMLNSFLENQLAVVSNELFKEFVELSTEVITRIKIDNEKGTVRKGGLFNEEYLPSETVMYTTLLASPLFISEKRDKGYKQILSEKNIKEEQFVIDFVKEHLKEVIQIGGNATLGKGLISLKMVKEEANV